MGRHRGRPHLVQLMSNGYRAALIEYLVERAARIRFELMRAGPGAMLAAITDSRDDLATAAPLAHPDLDEMTPEEILEATPLMVRLRALQAARA